MATENIAISAASTNLRTPCSSLEIHLKMASIVYAKNVGLNNDKDKMRKTTWQ